jgi:hypothetical protein
MFRPSPKTSSRSPTRSTSRVSRSKGGVFANPTFRTTTLSLSPREQVHADFFYGHGQFSPTTYRKIATACDWAAKETSAACNAALDTMSEEIGGYNV